MEKKKNNKNFLIIWLYC